MADGEACVGIDFGYCMGPLADVGVSGGHDGVSSLSVVGEVGLVAESLLEDAAGSCSMKFQGERR